MMMMRAHAHTRASFLTAAAGAGGGKRLLASPTLAHARGRSARGGHHLCVLASATSPSIGFIGAGQMAEALARGFDSGGACSLGSVSAWDPDAARCGVFEEMGATVPLAEGNKGVIEGCDVVFLAVKPQMLSKVLSEAGHLFGPDKILVSIAAGATCAGLEAQVAAGTRVVRVMPNTPCLVGRAASAVCAGALATPEDVELVKGLLASVVEQVEEYQMDAVTGMSGSGPAFVFAAIEAMADGGVAAGLPRGVALKLAAQTFAGAAEMVLAAEGGAHGHPGVLKDKVTSPAGTTIHGLQALEAGGMRSAMIEAVVAAARRSKELGE